MKKLMALLLALVMALSCVGALAENTDALVTSTTQMTFAVNDELVSALLPALAEQELTEEDQQMLSQLLAMLNNLGAKCVVAENGVQVELTLKDVPVATLVGAAGEDGLTLMSDLFPSYALTMPADALAQTNTLPDEAMLQSLEAHLNALMERISAYAGQPEMGEFPLENVVFNVKQPYEMTQKDVALLVLNWLKELMADEALAPLFASVASAEGLDAASLDGVIAQLESMTEEDLMPVNVATYTVVDEQGQPGADFYFTADMGDDENVLAVSCGMAQGVMYVHLAFGEAIYTSLDEMRQAAAEGGSSAITIDMAAMIDQSQDAMGFGLDFYGAGMYVGLTLQGAQTEAGLAQEIALYFMTNQAPLLGVSCLTVPGGELTASMTTEGKTVISLEELMADEEGTLSGGLQLDVMSFGLNNLIANAAAAMPDEVTALVTALTAPAQDATEVPVEGVTE